MGALQLSSPIFYGENYNVLFVMMKAIECSNFVQFLKQQLKEHMKKDVKALRLIQQGLNDTIFPRNKAKPQQVKLNWT